ncbi:MAG TPA: glutamate synthase large subunit [Saprospiraceae bacterium]|nr:glutamate synthase large subunit [Saprospiraceae bacterium]HMQ81586.1 glutamate synthase large subunit [Saprospiraceae bacterium]
MDQADQKGLYCPTLEKDSCGTGLIANLRGEKTHQLIENALRMLTNMEHRGACGCEPNTGDGAGILIQTPHEFFVKKCAEQGFDLPEFGEYGVGVVFFPADRNLRRQCRVLFDDYIDELDFELLGYRKIPTDHEEIGESAVAVEPRMEQVFVKPKQVLDRRALERRLYVLRKYATHSIHNTYPQSKDHFYITSFSYKTVVYKGQLTTYQLRPYFPDLQDELCKSAIAVIHSRFSTNTVPKWKLAQPFRYIAHNGEINTVTGNINWWKSKEKLLQSNLFTEAELEKLKPICGENLSDSGNFDNVLEFMVLNGFSLPHALMMMIPEAWEHDEQMEDYKRAFYEYHKTIMEPWDGPASICFTDGIVVGATLDRNGLRPSRYCLTDDDTLIVASEAGALPVDQSKVVLKGRLQPGRMLIADLDQHRIVGDEEVKSIICKRFPYRDWLNEYRIGLKDLKTEKEAVVELDEKTLYRGQQLFGFSREDLQVFIAPTTRDGGEPVGSMGTDTPLAVLSHRPQHLANYFKQLFAQVTNPPIDPIRERSVMSLQAMLGGAGNVLALEPERARFIQLKHPILTNTELEKIKQLYHPHFKSGQIEIVFDADGQDGRLQAAIDNVCAAAENLTRSGANILILSDRSADAFRAPIPSLLAAGAVHHHLVAKGIRSQTSIIVEAGDIWETHHFAALIGFGTSAINPYITYATIAELNRKGELGDKKSTEAWIDQYNKAIGKGILKIMSKIGISTLQSYQGAQIFEILGLHLEVVDKCFRGAVSRIQGIGFDGIAREVLMRHKLAFPAKTNPSQQLEEGGVYQWKRRGEAHLFNPQTIHWLQFATRKNDYTAFKKYTELINNQNEQALTLRGLLTFRRGEKIDLKEVEPIESIMRRFATGAMSFGSISHEAHTTLAIAMNRIGGKSNSGEGGEDAIRFDRKENGDWERSAIKQVASGRFGVTSHYLANADELQIKMAQGAKPGEGGQLPGHKVDDWIGRVRHSTPGVGLISPPPHHDIYSIEDLAQLIFDLKNANPAARINVKLVSKAGVGIIASGVAKAHADAILISGHDGGTGASPLTSIRHAGLPWELGLAESHQTLVRNNLRDRVVLQTDGQIRTGHDLAVATLLGAEEWGVATAALVVEGCIMMRKCHLNTCPVGIATQDPELRKRFAGDPQHVINFFRFLAQDLREIMADLGFRTIDDMVGKVEMLKVKQNIPHWKYKMVDLRPILYKEPADESIGQHKMIEQDHDIAHVLDRRMIDIAKPALAAQQFVSADFAIRNTDRATGAMLSHEISKQYGAAGLPDGLLQFHFRGSAGQSFGAFSARGLEFKLEGEANDYFGKGLSGARLIVLPDRNARFEASENIIIGNVAFYGATSGEAFINGMAGERFAVRNSGVTAVVEGIGDHGCEYMTGGLVVVLGDTGKNFAAGMSGGLAYVFNPKGTFEDKLNDELVDIDPLEESDFRQVYELLSRHLEYTASKKAQSILANWDLQKGSFTKVMPRDYKAVLAKRQQESALKVAALAG